MNEDTEISKNLIEYLRDNYADLKLDGHERL